MDVLVIHRLHFPWDSGDCTGDEFFTENPVEVSTKEM